MLVAVLCTILLLATVVVHYGSFRGVVFILRVSGFDFVKMVVIVLMLFAAHLIEIGMYAVVYHFAYLAPSLGGISGEPLGENLNALYLSMLAYSSLGFSDLIPTGGLRFIVGFEAVNGLLLITWSASITFLGMIELLGVDVARSRE